jgi:hypothetical protein
MKTDIKVDVISKAHPNVDAHGGIGQRREVPCLFLSIGTGLIVIDVALLTCIEHINTSHPLVLVVLLLHMPSCEILN